MIYLLTTTALVSSFARRLRDAVNEVVAPTAANALADQTFTQNSGIQTFDVSGDFTTGGGILSFSIPTSRTGITIDSATGVVSHDTSATGLLSAVSIIVRATNSAGSVDSAYSLTVAEQVAEQTVDIAHNGATWTVTRVTSQGVHEADGTPWVVTNGGDITQVTPVSAELDHTHEVNFDDPTIATVNHWAHGLVKTPGRALSGTTLAEKQAANDFGPGGQQGGQGYGFKCPAKKNFRDYDHTLNVDPGATGVALSAAPGVYTKGISYLTVEDLSWDGRPSLEALSVLTVYASAPPAGAFRAPFAGDGSISAFTLDDMDMTLFGNLSSVGYEDGVVPFAEAMNMLSQVLTYEHTFGVNAENVIPLSGAVEFSADYKPSTYYGTSNKLEADLMNMLHYDTWTLQQKRQIAARIVQRGIDAAKRIREGGIKYANGGHSQGFKPRIAFAAQLLGSVDLRNVLLITNEASSYDGYVIGDSVFAEDMQTDYLTQPMIDGSQGAAQSGRSVAFDNSQLGWPTYADSFGNGQPYNTLGNVSSLNTYAAGYENITFKGAVPYVLAMRRLPGAVAAMGSASDHWFDATDRYMEAWLDGTVDAPGVFLTGPPVFQAQGANSVSPFGRDSWIATRDALGPVWQAAGTVDPEAAVPTALTITEQSLPVYDTDPYNTGLASVPLTGTHDGGDGAELEYRVIDPDTAAVITDWTAFPAGAAGGWSVSTSVGPSWSRRRAEVRVPSNTGVTAAQTGHWFGGYIWALHGQSLAAKPITTTSSDGLALAVDAETLWVTYNSINGDSTIAPQMVNSGSTLGLRRMSRVLRASMDGPLSLTDTTHSGTARSEAADESFTGRSFTDSIVVPVQSARDGGSDVSLVLEHWITTDAATNVDFQRHWAPWYANLQIGGLGDNDDGSGVQDYTGGLVEAVPARSYTADNHLYDFSSDGTQGLFDPVRTKFSALLNAMPWVGGTSIADGSIATGTEQKHLIMSKIDGMISQSTWFEPATLSSVAGWDATDQEVYYGHLAMPGTTHVASNDVDGESLVAAYLAQAVARAYGKISQQEPYFDWANAATAADGSHVDVTVKNLGGFPLSTAFLRQAAGDYAGTFEGDNWIAPTILPGDIPELHPLHGFMLGGSYSGFNAVIQDAAAGVVRFTHESGAFSQGETIRWGDGIGMTSSANRDGARPFIHLPLVATPHLSGTGYGTPVRRGVAKTVAYTIPPITEEPPPPPPADESASRPATDSRSLLGPALESGVTQLTVEMDVNIPLGGGAVEIFEYQSNTLRLRVDNRDGKRDLFFSMNAGPDVLFSNFQLPGLLPAGRRVLTVSARQNNGAGEAEFHVWVDGSKVSPVDGTNRLPAGTTQEFAPDIRNLEIFKSTYAVTVYGFAVYNGFTANADTSGMTVRHDLAPADFVTVPSGFSFEGTGAFTLD